MHDLLLEREAGAALVRERGVGDRPPTVELADEMVCRHEHIVEEHLVELGLAGDLPQRAHLDTRLVEVDHEVGDAAVLGRVGIGPHEGDAPAGEAGVGGPDLLAPHQPAALGRFGDGAQRGEVGAGVGLAEELAPDLAGVEDRRQPAGLLLRRAARQQRRPGEVDADPVDRLRSTRTGVLHVVERHLDRAGASASHALGPGDRHPAVGGERGLPAPAPGHLVVDRVEAGRARQVACEVLAEPGSCLGGEGGLAVGQGQVHRRTSTTAPEGVGRA